MSLPFPFHIFKSSLDEGTEILVIRFTNNAKLKGRANMLADKIKIQNDLDKAEH